MQQALHDSGAHDNKYPPTQVNRTPDENLTGGAVLAFESGETIKEIVASVRNLNNTFKQIATPAQDGPMALIKSINR